MQRNFAKPWKQVHRSVAVHLYGEFARMSAGFFGNGQVVPRPSSLISGTGPRFGGSSLGAPMNRRMSHHSHAPSSLQSTTVRGRKGHVISMSSRGLLAN